jgi:hypothetical protein
MAAWKAFREALLGILRELSDENAYQRHLCRHGCQASPEAYRNFQAEHFQAKYQRAKCC